MRKEPGISGVTCRSVLLAVPLLCLALSSPVHAAQVNNGCMQDLYDEFGQGGSLNCTANDIEIAGVSNVTVTDDGCAFVGDTVTFDATLEVLLTAQDRHDIGIYLATDGGDALTGDCLISTLPFEPANEACIANLNPFACCTGAGTGTCDFVDLDGTADELSGPPNTGACSDDNTLPCTNNADCVGTCDAIAANTTQDECGDITQDPRNPIFHDVTSVTALCVDNDMDGLLDIAASTSWRQPGANELCLSPLYTFPGAPSKCRNDLSFEVPITVPQTIEVCKELIPGSDLGLFNLRIDGVTELADASDGECTGAVAVITGNHTVSETAGTGTTLTAYDTDISCEDQVGRCTGDNTVRCLNDAICIQGGIGTCDLTPTPVGSCTSCTSLPNITVDPNQPTTIVCTITNTNLCEAASCDAPTECDGGATCNPATGLCEDDPDPAASTPCTDIDGDVCTVAGCDGNGSCDQAHVSTPSSTPCPDIDGNACTTAGCNGAGSCDQTHQVTSCPGSTGECDAGEFCDPADGLCKLQPDAPASTPCTDTDGNACTIAGCDGAGSCDQNHLNTTASNPCPDTDGDDCTTAGCDGAGSCDQNHMVVTCAPQGDPECDNGQTCNPGTGLCEDDFVAASTPCSDTDGNDCTDAGCDGAGTCSQMHIFAPDSSPCPDTDGSDCTTAGCDGAGTCDQEHQVVTCAPQGDPQCDNGQTCNPGTGLCEDNFAAASTPCFDADSNACTTAGCDGAGACDQTHILDADSTPCPDIDGDQCTISGCDGAGTCDQNHGAVPCNPSLDPDCDPTGETCNPGTGLCETNYVGASTPCTDTDGNACTTAGCDGAGACDQSHVSVPDSTSCPDTDGNACTTPGCQAGVCDQAHIIVPDSTPCPDTDGTACTIAGCDGAGSCDQNHGAVVCDPAADPPCDLGEQCNPNTGACDDQYAPVSTPCEFDGDLCTTDHCDGTGNCVFLEDVPCPAPLPPCEGGDVCNPATGNCDPVAPDGPVSTPCEADNEICTIDHCNGTGQCVFLQTNPIVQCQEHYKCYKARGFDKINQDVTLTDQFGTTVATVKRALHFCNPASKNGLDIQDDTAHLGCYKIKEKRLSPPPPLIEVEDQFGVQQFRVLTAKMLCNPAEKDMIPSGLNINHFKCYKVKRAPGASKFERREVTIEDQFDTTKLTTVIKPLFVCNPVAKNDEPVPDPVGHLACYRIHDVKGQAKFQERPVATQDQFTEMQGTVASGDCHAASFICVPATKRELSPSGAFLDMERDLLD